MIFTTEAIRDIRHDCEGLSHVLGKAREAVGTEPIVWSKSLVALKLRQVLEYASEVAPVIPIETAAGIDLAPDDIRRLLTERIDELEALIDEPNAVLAKIDEEQPYDARSWAGMVAGIILSSPYYSGYADLPEDWMVAPETPSA